MIRIKSITDVITNSSTEVYTYFDEDGLEKIKEIVNTIILVSEGHGTFDGYFEIGFVLAPGEDEVIKYLCENEEKPVPDDLLEIYKVIINDNTIPLKEEYSNSFGYFILNNNIMLPENNALIYYIKEYERYGIDDEINMSASYIDYLYLYTVIKALSRLEFNMDKEEKELLQLSNMIIKTTLSKYGSYTLKRDNEFAL